jgi:hypothetical protein
LTRYDLFLIIRRHISVLSQSGLKRG